MRVGLLVDATCDLPTSVFQRNGVHIIPTSVLINNKDFTDTRDPDVYAQFYEDNSASQLLNATHHSATGATLHAALRDNLLYHYDHLLLVTPHIKLSNTLKNLREAVFQMQQEFAELRTAASIKTPFKIRIVESNTAYAGYGLVLYEALRLLNEKARSVDQIKQPLDGFKGNVTTFVLPGVDQALQPKFSGPPFNMNWLTIQKQKWSRNVPLFSVGRQGINHYSNLAANTATNDFFEFIYDRLTQTKLQNHMVNISYAGKLSLLRVQPIFKALNEHVKNKGGKMVYSIMSPTNSAQLGKAALSVSFAGEHL